MQKFFGKNVKKNKLKHAAPRRVPEPPSPGSFTTPEFVVDGSAEGSSIHSSNEHPGPHVPPLKLDFENRDSLSEWFPPSMLKVGDIFNPPHRDASLRPPEPLDRPLWNISREKISFSTDDVIIIEPERPMPPLPTEVESEPENSNKLTDSRDASPGPSLSRRPVPNPIQIPFNPTVSRVRIHRSPSVGANSSPFARTRGDGPSRGASRPVSSYSDEMSSAVSGTTLARDLGSFIITGNSRDSRYRYTLTRQDSATLPKGEHPFMNGSSSSYWKDKRISNGEVILSPEYALGSPVPPVPPIPSSAELSAMAINSATSSKRNSRRRNSIGGEDVAAAQRDQEILEDVSDKASASASRHRRANSLSRISKDQMPINPNRFSKISEASNSPTTPAKSSYSAINSVKSLRESYKRGHTFEDVSKPKPPSTNPSHPESQSEPEPRSSSETANESISSHPETSASVLSPDPPTTGESGSMYSMSSMGRSYTTPGTSIKSPGSAPLYPNSATSAESRLPRRSPSEPLLSGGSDRSRPTILLPHGDRPYTQVPQTASPLSSRTSDESMRDMRLPFRPRGSPGVPAVTPVDSPDLIELMFGGVVQRRPSRKRAGSQPPPMIFSPDLTSPDSTYSNESPSTASAARQTFPETPYLFTPYTSSAFPPPPIPGSAQLTAPRMGSLRGTGRTPLSSSQVFRHMSVTVASSSSSSGSRSSRWPMSPPLHSASPSVHSIFSDPGSWSIPSASEHMHMADHQRLGAIEEGSLPPTPLNQNPPRTPSTPEPKTEGDEGATVVVEESTPPRPSTAPTQAGASTATTTPSLGATTETSPSLDSTAPGSRPVSEFDLSRPSSLIPTKRSLSPLPPPSPTTSSARLSPAPSQISHASELLDVLSETGIPEGDGSLPPYFERSSRLSQSNHEQLPPPYGQYPPASASDTSALVITPPQQIVPLPQTPPRLPSHLPPQPSQTTPQSDVRATPTPPPSDTRTPPRLPRSLPRPAAPMGPRKLSGSLLSLATSRARAGSVSSTASMPTGRYTPSRPPPVPQPSPKFQTSPIKFKGLTMEAAQWTFTQEELQELVRDAIKSSADPTAIRLVAADVINQKLPAEIQRLETLSAELRTEYTTSARRRNNCRTDLNAIASGEVSDPIVASRVVQEMSDVQDQLDRVSEELYTVMDQITQLKHLQDIHSQSALAMALRKLNTSLVKHMAENKNMKERMAALEVERDDAWEKAQEVAFQLEETQERLLEFGVPSPPTSSRPSSRIFLARKTSLRASKAGFRSPSRLRSQRSSAASSAPRSSTMGSPASRTNSNIPPVPRLPTLGIVTNDLPSRSSGLSSDVTPSSEVQAMVEAQREIMDMLGITDDTLSIGSGSVTGSFLRRRKSLSAVETSPTSANRTRRTSEILSPVQRATNMTDRAAVLAAIGMSSHEY